MIRRNLGKHDRRHFVVSNLTVSVLFRSLMAFRHWAVSQYLYCASFQNESFPI